MAADIFTKAFTNADAWSKACFSILHVYPDRFWSLTQLFAPPEVSALPVPQTGGADSISRIALLSTYVSFDYFNPFDIVHDSGSDWFVDTDQRSHPVGADQCTHSANSNSCQVDSDLFK